LTNLEYIPQQKAMKLPVQLKVKVKLSPCLTKHYAMTSWGSRSWCHLFWTL